MNNLEGVGIDGHMARETLCGLAGQLDNIEPLLQRHLLDKNKLQLVPQPVKVRLKENNKKGRRRRRKRVRDVSFYYYYFFPSKARDGAGPPVSEA